MKIGVKIGPTTERGVKRVAEEAERAGFDSVWLSERVAVPWKGHIPTNQRSIRGSGCHSWRR